MKLPFHGKNWRELLSRDSLRPAELAAFIVGLVALLATAGTARWTWLVVDEQVKLREEFMQLKNQQEQVGIQYEFWLKQLQEERAAAAVEQQLTE